MNSRRRVLSSLVLGMLLLLAGSLSLGQEPAGLAGASPEAHVGTGFTYQGRLTGSNGAVNGTCDFRFRLFDAASGGSQIGNTEVKTGVTLADGLFTVGVRAIPSICRWSRGTRWPGAAAHWNRWPRGLVRHSALAWKSRCLERRLEGYDAGQRLALPDRMTTAVAGTTAGGHLPEVSIRLDGSRPWPRTRRAMSRTPYES